MNRRQSKTQQRAAHALRRIDEQMILATQPGWAFKAEEYRSRVRDLGPMIQMNGLGQTLAFLISKSKEKKRDGSIVRTADWRLYEDMGDWLLEVFTGSARGDALRWLTQQETPLYRQATIEAIEYSLVLKRLAEINPPPVPPVPLPVTPPVVPPPVGGEGH